MELSDPFIFLPTPHKLRYLRERQLPKQPTTTTVSTPNDRARHVTIRTGHVTHDVEAPKNCKRH